MTKTLIGVEQYGTLPDGNGVEMVLLYEGNERESIVVQMADLGALLTTLMVMQKKLLESLEGPMKLKGYLPLPVQTADIRIVEGRITLELKSSDDIVHAVPLGPEFAERMGHGLLAAASSLRTPGKP